MAQPADVLASIGVLTTCLLLIGFSWLLFRNINSMVTSIGDQNEVVFSSGTMLRKMRYRQTLQRLSRIPACLRWNIQQRAGVEEYKETMGESAILLKGWKGKKTVPGFFPFPRLSTFLRLLQLFRNLKATQSRRKSMR